MRKRWLIHVANAIALLLVLTVIWWLMYGKDWYEKRMIEEKPIGKHAELQWSAWIVDWEWEAGKQQAAQFMEKLDSLQLFLGYFNEQGEIIWGEEQSRYVSDMQQQIAQLNEQRASNKQKALEPELYVTLVNDVLYADGSSLQKSNELVANMLASHQVESDYIEQFVALVKEAGLDGLELDFENIDQQLWPELVSFYEMLYRRLHEEQLLLRIVLEPKMKFEDYKFPEGPQYVVMAYNLYGSHSGPGPKANLEFIGKLTARMEDLPGEPSVAIATGGFQWDQGNNAKSLSEQDIDALLITHGIQAERDKKSGAMHFTYSADGKRYEVWYADGATLQFWAEAIQQRGYSQLAIWRLGNVSEATLTHLQ